jgi:hypothetical protein
MASILNVDQINNAAGTSAVTIDPSTGKPSFPNGMTLPAGVGGKMLQVVNGTTAITASTTSSTYADTGLTATITPSNTSSKILVQANVPDAHNAASVSLLYLNLVRDSTQLIEFVRHGDALSGQSLVTYGGSTSYLDSPATTSATTYKVQFAVHSNGGTQYVFLNGSTGTITLMEIAQ